MSVLMSGRVRRQPKKRHQLPLVCSDARLIQALGQPITDEIRNDPQKFKDWQFQRNYLLHRWLGQLLLHRHRLSDLSYRLDRCKPDTFNFEEAREKAALRQLYRYFLTVSQDDEVQKDYDEERREGWYDPCGK